jgi:NADH:ubiquinone oxidoreductase subunit B-like Fe-S oxidoreductase
MDLFQICHSHNANAAAMESKNEISSFNDCSQNNLSIGCNRVNFVHACCACEGVAAGSSGKDINISSLGRFGQLARLLHA